MRKLTIAIPVYNSENTISNLVDKLIEELTGFQLEIILVNDCSKDNSKKVCVDLQEKYSEIVKFYSLAKNVGEHNAVMAALNNSTGDYTIIIDDDFQNPVSEVKKLAEYSFSNDFDVIYTFYDQKKHSFFRNLGSRFNDRIANWLLRKPKSLYLSSFKSISKFIVAEIIKYDLPYPYIDGLILRTTSNIGKMKVEHSKRQLGKSQYTLVKLVGLWLSMVTNFSIKPLRFATILGFVFSIVGFLIAIAGILMKLLDPTVPMGYASLLVSVAILGGIQLIAIGMVGEYIGRTFLSINKAPQFVIKERFEKKPE
ncbi:MAG: glycosyltransferase family 2 protein [Bacteroidales bacterium]|nr:glycosyltransferase family 2 protein [Bacteroidales bacterium]